MKVIVHCDNYESHPVDEDPIVMERANNLFENEEVKTQSLEFVCLVCLNTITVVLYKEE